MKSIHPPYKKSMLFLMFLFALGLSGLKAQNVFINEFLASNATINPDIIDFDDYSDWIELYNNENSAVDLSGYYLTDNFSNPTKWLIPDGMILRPKSFLRIWADGYDDKPGTQHVRDDEPHGIFYTSSYHLGFKLSIGGEELALFDPDGNLIDSVSYGIQLRDVSMGRKPDGGSNWFYFGEPTPGSANITNGILNTGRCSPPSFTAPAGFYNSSQAIEITANSGDEEIRYTLDGSRPASTSALYTKPLQIDTTTVVRARTFNNSKLPGEIVTKTYIINSSTSLSTMSITAFPNTLWGNETGIFSLQMKGREVPVAIEYFEPSGKPGFSVNAGIRLSGQASFQYPQKPMTIELKERFGDEQIYYQVFKNRDVENYTALYLRNSGTPDNRHTMFRDAFQHSLVINQMDLDCQAYQPVSTYINGKYWGIYNMRDKINPEYLAYLHNIDPYNIDLLEYEFHDEPIIIEGNSEDYKAFLEYVDNADLSSAENYNYVKTQMDIDEYINYMITEIFCDNINWLNTNVKWWREKSENGKWRWILLDMDWGFGTEYGTFTSHYTHNTIAMATSQPGTFLQSSSWATVLFRNLLQNGEFKSEFIQRFAGYLNTTFTTERVLGVFDSIKSSIHDEMSRHIERWNDDPNYIIYDNPPIMNMSEWEKKLAVMRTFGENRTELQFQHIIDFFGLSGTFNLELKTSHADAGRIIVNNVNVPLNRELQYFKGIPVTFKAIPNIGYRFKEWKGIFDNGQDSISTKISSDAVITAVFESIDVSTLPAEISSNTTLSHSASPFYAANDITILPGANLTIEPGVEIFMNEGKSIIVNGSINIQGTEELPVIIAPNRSSGAQNWGALIISESDTTCYLSNVIIEGGTNGPDKSNHIGALSCFKSDIVIDNLTIPNAPFPVFVQYGNITLSNSRFHSEKTCDLINVKYASSALIENCEFRGNSSYDTDAIDYDQITNGIIRNNLIYNFYGDNSDGIDLGEGTKDILISGNTILNCFDKGISVGQASTCTITNNVIVNCAQGVGVKDNGSYAYVDRNTFYACALGVASFEKNFGVGGGSIDVVNSIFANSIDSPYLVDDLSALTIEYSLANNKELPGTGNIYADPRFLNDFRLDAYSPAIDAGNPAGAKDPDGSTADMGAFSYDNNFASVLINEIHYNPVNGEEFEFIELYNSGKNVVDLSGYYLSSPFEFVIPSSTIIQPSNYLVLAKNPENFSDVNSVLDWGEGTLPDIRADIMFKNPEGITVDFVSYSSRDDWVGTPNGNGPSLELASPDLENIYFANWKASTNDGGSPGLPNFEMLVEKLFINELMAVNNFTIADEFGEFNDWIEIYNAGNMPVNLGGLYITDDLTRPTKYFFPPTEPDVTTIPPKSHIILWADEQSSQGPVHLNFKLNAELEEVALVQVFEKDTSIIDHITFENQQADISFGRFYDGEDSWQILNLPSPGILNNRDDLFRRGILLVNGITPQLNDEFYDPYANKAYWGDYPITFWDYFGVASDKLPSTVPEAIGSYTVPLDTLKQFSTVIWVSNNYGGDLNAWRKANIPEYLKFGGNVFLMTRSATSFIDSELADRIGIQWSENPYSIIENYESVFDGLRSIQITGSQTFVASFDTALTNSESTLLFSENNDKGLGVWHKPVKGGLYNTAGGQFVFLSSRPYRFSYPDLRQNISYILGNFFGEKKVITGTDESETIVKSFVLSQNYPNPFNPTTTIEYSIPVEDVRRLTDSSPALQIKLVVYDVLGREVATLVDQRQKTGRYKVEFNASALTSGVYFYKISAGKYSDTKKLLLLK